MKNIFKKVLIGVSIVGLATVSTAREYKAPPTSSTSGSIPYISDQAMEKCVKLYNHAKWLKDEIDSIYVDRYSQSSVNNYNNKVNNHSNMINQFNSNCAGKQSYSAWKAAQKLNNR